eukprot:1414633-Amphidinium_carterae.1
MNVRSSRVRAISAYKSLKIQGQHMRALCCMPVCQAHHFDDNESENHDDITYLRNRHGTTDSSSGKQYYLEKYDGQVCLQQAVSRNALPFGSRPKHVVRDTSWPIFIVQLET